MHRRELDRRVGIDVFREGNRLDDPDETYAGIQNQGSTWQKLKAMRRLELPEQLICICIKIQDGRCDRLIGLILCLVVA